MKLKYLFAIGFLLSAFALHAQAPYTGGEGDGYASTSLSISEPGTSEFQFDIATTEVAGETIFELSISGLATPGRLEVFDAAGRRIQQWSFDAPQEITLEVPTSQWASGAYIFRLEVNGSNYARKVIHASGGGN